MVELSFDVVEEILVRLDPKDLIRCKSVCKLWQSLISSPGFVIAHLKHSCKSDLNNHDLRHRRIGMGLYTDDDSLGFTQMWQTMEEDEWLTYNELHVVGSCNGLVCASVKDAQFVVTNPSTREQIYLPTPPPYQPYPPPDYIQFRDELCWGFGYDSSVDDYKVIVGFRKKKRQMLFHALTLKSNTWKTIGLVKYEFSDGISGILCDGALYWFMWDEKYEKKVIISLCLSTDEFKEIPQPTDAEYEGHDPYDYKLGFIEDCLCIFQANCSSSSSKKWKMKNSKWELYNNVDCENKYDVAHGLTIGGRFRPMNYIYGVNDGELVPSVGSYIRASIFVKSLVSPRVTNDGGGKKQLKIARGNIRKRKRMMFCKPLLWRNIRKEKKHKKHIV